MSDINPNPVVEDDDEGDESEAEGTPVAPYADDESETEGDNSLDLENEAYVGVDTEYRNHAYDHLAPMKSEDEDAAKVEEQAKEHEVIRAVEAENVGFRGYATETPHPSERENPADKYINANRQILQNQAGSGSSE